MIEEIATIYSSALLTFVSYRQEAHDIWYIFSSLSPYQAGDTLPWSEHYCGRCLAAKMTVN
jgi:hypothetical protein